MSRRAFQDQMLFARRDLDGSMLYATEELDFSNLEAVQQHLMDTTSRLSVDGSGPADSGGDVCSSAPCGSLDSVSDGALAERQTDR